MYQTGDLISHPLHGAGSIGGIAVRNIGGKQQEYYELILFAGGMTVLVPTVQCEAIGVRPVLSEGEMRDILSEIPGIEAEMSSGWNRRFRDNMDRIRSGNPRQVAWVIKGLTVRDKARTLSTAERRMLHSARQIFLSELVASLHAEYREAAILLDMALTQ